MPRSTARCSPLQRSEFGEFCCAWAGSVPVYAEWGFFSTSFLVAFQPRSGNVPIVGMVGNFLEIPKVCRKIRFYCRAVIARDGYGINIRGRISLICTYLLKHFEREQNGLSATFARKRI
jgi:hypothetical protein